MIKRKIKVLYHNKQYKFEQHGNWIDLAIDRTISMKPGEFKLIPLGVSMALPNHYEAQVVPRSSTFKKYELLQANSMGVIDSEYRGTSDVWQFPAIAFNKGVMINKNTRLCQFRVTVSMNAPWYIKVLDLFTKFTFKEVESLDYANRGGFGSSGN